MSDREREIAIMEAYEINTEHEYFVARPGKDIPAQKAFRDGFERGWNCASPKFPSGLPEEIIRQVVANLPGGLEGFMKGWGWLQFARDIEKAQKIDKSIY